MIVLVLVLVWMAALLPIALKKRSEWDLSSSITQFRHRRRALDRFAPVTNPAAAGPRGVTTTTSPRRDARDARDARGERVARARRQALRQRRRRTLAVLVGTFGGSLVLGAIPALRPLWDLTLVAALATVGYLAALVYVRRLEELAAERDRKVVELAARARQSAIVPVQPRPPFVIVGAGS